MWFQTEGVSPSSHDCGPMSGGVCGIMPPGLDRACHSPLRDFNHILDSSLVTFANSSRGGALAENKRPMRAGLPSTPKTRARELRIAPTSSCRSCSHVCDARECLPIVEDSYLQEIGRLQGVAKQFDEERTEAVGRTEEMRVAYERSQHVCHQREREIQVLGDQMHRLEDKLHRTEHQLASIKSIYRRDAQFHREQQLSLFEGNEQNAREALVFAEASWRTVVQERCSNTILALVRERYQSVGKHCEQLEDLGHSGRKGVARSQPPTGRPVVGTPYSCPSITCRSPRRHEDSSSSPMTEVNNGLLDERFPLKTRADAIIEDLKRELEEKQLAINSLQSQLKRQEEELKRPTSNRGLEESLVVEMQAEIDDMLLNELLLTHSCERYALEAEAAEELTHALQWLLRKYAFALQGCPFSTSQKTPETQKGSGVLRTPETQPRLLDACSTGSPAPQTVAAASLEEVGAAVGDAVMERLRKELQGHFLPVKLSVESMRASSEQLVGDLKKMARDAGQSCLPVTPSVTLEDIRSEHATLLQNIKLSIDAVSGVVASPVSAELKKLREAVVKVGRLTSYNNRVMDDKLDDILQCQSAVSRHMILSSLPYDEGFGFGDAPAAESSTTVPPSKMDPSRTGKVVNSSGDDTLDVVHEGGSSCVGSKRDTVGKKQQSNGKSGARDDTTGPVFHGWDLDTSTSRITVPSVDVSNIRKTPYDIEEV